jgi:hypothetical protein
MVPNGKWIWKVTNPDGTEECSAEFATLKECSTDAQLHGYVAWKSEDERRRDLMLDVVKTLGRE